MSKILREETAYVILWDPDGEMIYLQTKDGTYWIKAFQYLHCFIGTGVVPEFRETPYQALSRKLKSEMPRAQKKIIGEMRFWKIFRLPWGETVEGEYTCHVFIMTTQNKYEMMDLADAIGSAGKKRATPTYISIDRFKQIPDRKYMGSLGIVAQEFLNEIETDPEFWDSLETKK